jgi:circadian clock protein KaiC
MKRIATGTDGLDRILGGGIPQGSVVLLAGAPGTMKTSLAYSVLYGNAMRGVKGLYISLEQSRASLVDHVDGMGFEPKAVKDALSVLDLATLRKRMGDGGSWMEVFRMYTQSIRAGFPYQLLVLDSLDALELLAKFQNYRQDVYELFKWLRGLGCTSIVLGELPTVAAKEPPEAFGKHKEDYLADGIVHLLLEKRGDFEVKRLVRVVKMRGAHHDTGYHSIEFDKGFRVTDLMG